MRVSETFVALFSATAVPTGVVPESSAPVIFWIVPPEFAVPLPVTVKLPEVFDSRIPLAPPFADTLVSEIASGVVPLLLVTLTAVPLPVLIVPLVAVIVFVLSVAFKPA